MQTVRDQHNVTYYSSIDLYKHVTNNSHIDVHKIRDVNIHAYTHNTLKALYEPRAYTSLKDIPYSG